MNTKSRELRFLTTTALFAALLCVTAPFSISIGPIPISLATFTVYVAALVCGWKGGCLAVAAYLVLGAVGLPVFSGFMGGFERLVGPTGGYLIGYIPCAITVGIFSDMAKKHPRSVGYSVGDTRYGSSVYTRHGMVHVCVRKHPLIQLGGVCSPIYRGRFH